MASQFDESDFIDRDFQSSQSAYSSAAGQSAASTTLRPPSSEELQGRVGEAQQKLAELRRAQEQLERERALLEEARRRRLEFQKGREEMLENLTRGVTLMEQAEFTARRDAEQMAKTLVGLREALSGVQSARDETWTQDNWNTELTKGLATIENARMEWNQARLKWALLNGAPADIGPVGGSATGLASLQQRPFLELCKLGVALTWPIVLVGLIGLVLLLVFHLG